jgi:Clp protease
MVLTVLRTIASAVVTALLTMGAADAMTMRVVGDEVILSGQVVQPDIAQFTTILQNNPAIQIVLFMNSPGGDAVANRAISAMIIEHKFTTAVAGYCVSACAMLFLSGTERYFSDGTPLAMTSLGFHGNYSAAGLGPELRLLSLKTYVLDRTGGKADPALIDQWTHYADAHNTTRFIYPRPDAADKTPFTFHCLGPRANQGDYSACEPIAGANALTMGIITSTQILHVNH